jgi:hypothetical protein
MRVWHFTGLPHLPKIIRAGAIGVTESNIGSPKPGWAPYGKHVGPDVVWCFSTPVPRISGGSMLTTASSDKGRRVRRIDKRLVRFTLDVPEEELVDFVPWAKELGIHPRWLVALASRNRADEWRCVLRPVAEHEWMVIEWREGIRDPWREVERLGPYVLNPR